MRLFEESENRAALYTSFLTTKGKTMFDAFIVKPKLAFQTSEDMEFWIDIHSDDITPLRKHLRRYAMRKNIRIDIISDIIKSFSVQTLSSMESKSLSNSFEEDGSPKNLEGYFYKDLQDRAEMFESAEYPGHYETDIAAFVDPRTAAQGVRVLCAEESFEIGTDITQYRDSNQIYDLYRMSLGLLEGSNEIGNNFPLNVNLQ